MTDKELEKKAEETVKRNVCGDCNKCQSHGYIGCDVYKYSKDSFIAGAKAMQDDKERVKSELETNISSLKEIVELLQQIEKMKYCHSCKSYELNNLKNCQTCDGNYSNWELAEWQRKN
jgi:hypothetical protein